MAKAMVISTNQDTIVGGEVLGLQYYEVLVNVVLKREAELARGYDGMQTMGDAHHMSIAWPSNRVKFIIYIFLPSYCKLSHDAN